MTVLDCVNEAVLWLRQQRAQDAPRPWMVVVPALVPYVPLLFQHVAVRCSPSLRVAAVPGLPFVGSSAYARLQRLIAALESDLSAESVAGLLPFVRRGSGDALATPEAWLPRITVRRALFLLQATGAHPDASGPHRWHDRLAALLARARADLNATKRMDRSGERRSAMVRAQEAQRVIRELRPILPALRELDSLADALTRGGTLTELLDRYWSFARKWLVMPMPAETRNAVREALRPPAVEGEEGVAGGEFLHWLSRRLNALVIPGNQMLDPHVVVMTGFPERGAEPLFVMPRGDDEEAFARTPDQSPHGALPHATSASETVTNRQWNSSLANGRAGTRERKALAPAKLLFLEIDPAWLQDWGSRAGRPVSATGLALFLSCPYRFALERMARLQPPAPHLHTARISPHVFGELVHGGVEAFLRRSGAEFYRRVRDVFHWLECARGLVEDKFASFLDSYPLWGMEARTRELARLQVAVRKVILDEWNSQAGEFVAAELRFGEPVGVRLQVSQREFYVRGSIDWLIRLPEGLAVRELKTVGQALGEAQGLDLRQGLQLGLYVVAAEAGALVEKGSVHEATILTVTPDRVQRTLIATTALQSLRETTERALGVMFSLVRTGFFPRTPAAGDCVRCPFFAHCGEEASGGVRQASKEAHLPPAVAEYVNWRATISESGLLGGGCLEGAL